MENRELKMKGKKAIKIDEGRCIGCGVCQNLCPEGFEIVGGKSRIKNEKAKCIGEAIKLCPVEAISWKGEK